MERGSPRRRVLASLGGVGAVALAGCIGGGSDDDEEEDDGPPLSGDADGEFLEHGMEEPESIPAEYQCDGLCSMPVEEWSHWHGQLAHESGEAVFFCGPGDMVLYAQDPAGHSEIDTPIVAGWVAEMETTDLVDALEAVYVLDQDSDRYEHEPMALNPRPFGSQEAAAAYVEQYDDLDEDDIVEFEDLDRDNTEVYSGTNQPTWER